MKPRLLHVDIETSPHEVYCFQTRDVQIGINQIKKPSRMTCFSAKWHGEAKVTFVAEWHSGGRKAMLRTLCAMLEAADAVISYNGDSFDLPRIQGELVKERLPPMSPITSIDLYKTVKKLGLASGKLEWAVQYFEIGAKVKHAGMPLWIAVSEGCPKARAKMERYNRGDANLTSALYNLLAPYMTKHPRIRDGKKGTCTNCGSSRLQHRGNRYTLSCKIERLQCQKCGKWSDGKRTKL